MRYRSSILFLLALACSSTKLSQRPANIPQPDLGARLLNQPFFGSGTEAPVTIEVGVRNRATVPITVRRLEVDSPGMGQYTLVRSVRDYRETVGAGEEKALTTFATAVAQTTNRPTEPLTLRVIVEFEAAPGQVWREVVMLR